MSETHIDYLRDPLTGGTIQDADFRPLMVKKTSSEEVPSLPRLLERIATALEEQNCFNQEWIALSKEHYTKAHGLALKRMKADERLLTLQEQNVQRDQAYREEILRNAELQAKQANEMVQAAYEAYLESLKSPSKELVQAVQEACVADLRAKMGVSHE